MSLKEYLNKQLKREVETVGSYQFTETELCLILVYTIVKGSTNQNFDYKQVFYLATPDYTSIIYATPDTPLDSP